MPPMLFSDPFFVVFEMIKTQLLYEPDVSIINLRYLLFFCVRDLVKILFFFLSFFKKKKYDLGFRKRLAAAKKVTHANKDY